MKSYLKTSAAGLIAAAMAHPAAAEISADDLVAAYQAEGFDFIEVTVGINQIKVEATEGNQQIEVIYDRETGMILESETQAADRDEVNRQGVEVRTRARDFYDGDDEEDGRDDEEDEDDDEDHDEDDEGDRDEDGDDDEDHDEDDDED